MSLDISLSGLRSINEAIEVVSNNISNAETEGYKSRTLETVESSPTFKDGHMIGTGTLVTKIKTAGEPLLLERISSSETKLSYSETMNTQYSMLEEMLDGNQIRESVENLFKVFEDLKNNPTSTSIKQLVVEEAKEMLNVFDNTTDLIETQQDEDIKKIQENVTHINNALDKLNLLYQEQSTVKDNNYLKDKVDLIIQDLSEYGQVKFNEKENGYPVISMNGLVLFEDLSSNHLSFDTGNNEIILQNTEVTDFFKNGGIGANYELIDNFNTIKEEYQILQTSITYEVNQLIQQSVTRELSSTSDNLGIEENRIKMGLTKEELPNINNVPLLDLPTLEGLKPGNITFTIFPNMDNLEMTEPRKYTININHQTTLNSIKESLENYVVNGQEPDYIGPSYDENGIELPESTTLYGIKRDEPVDLGFEVTINNGIGIENSDYTFSLDDGSTNLMDMLKIQNFFNHENDKYIINKEYDETPAEIFKYIDSREIEAMEYNKLLLNEVVDTQYKDINFDNDYIYKLSVANCPDLNYTEIKIGHIDNFSEGLNRFNFNLSLKVDFYTEQTDTLQKTNEVLNSHYNKLTKVNIDKEMSKLIELQAAYQANAKVIAAMNQVFDALLSIK